MPDVVQAGRVAAGLTDWQTITYFLIFLLVISTVERLIAGWQSRSTAAKLGDAIDRLADATESRATDIKVTLALMQAAERDLKDNQTEIKEVLRTLERRP
jgi:ABC-type transporter Mla subunit MlaD